MYSGPFLVVDVLSPVNVVVQRSVRANRIVIHIDKLKRCFSKTPKPWIAVASEVQRDAGTVVDSEDEVEDGEDDEGGVPAPKTPRQSGKPERVKRGVPAPITPRQPEEHSLRRTNEEDVQGDAQGDEPDGR